jgi:SAM-dependent methyltransferase
VTRLPPAPDDWWVPLARHLGDAYLQYAFTAGTEQEVEFIAETLGATAGERLLDVGCGPGRHSLEFARRGVQVLGIDISPEFVAIAHRRAVEAELTPSFFPMDARELPFDAEFDMVICLCQGAFGLGLPDLQILRNIRKSMKPGGRLALGAANVFYALNHLTGHPTELGGPVTGEFDPVKMLSKATVKGVIGEGGATADFEIWNSCYTPRELEWIANGAGLNPEAVFGVSPGAYGREAPTFEHPELLLIARKP